MLLPRAASESRHICSRSNIVTEFFYFDNKNISRHMKTIGQRTKFSKIFKTRELPGVALVNISNG